MLSSLLLRSLQDDKSRRPEIAQTGIRPASFKAMIGRGHADFSTLQQQVPLKLL